MSDSSAATATATASSRTETPYPVVTIASDAHSLAADSEVVRTAGTAAEHVIDFVTVNRSAKTVSLTRLGAGEDRSYSYQ